MRETIFSPCRKYRYTLWRTFSLFELGDGRLTAAHQPFVQFIGLNPSTADETNDDPTIRRCVGYAKTWGFGALCQSIRRRVLSDWRCPGVCGQKVNHL